MLFPFEKYRKHQKEFAEAVYDAIEEGKVLLAEVPTGVGKTAAVLAAALHFMNKHKILFLTPKNLQHKIVYETIEMIEDKYDMEIPYQDLIGKRNLCLMENIDKENFYEACKLLREKGKCPYYEKSKKIEISARRVDELLKLSKKYGVCPYEIAIKNVSKAKVVIGNFHHVFNKNVAPYFFSRGGFDLSDSILIIDEAHNLPQVISEIYTKTLSEKTIKSAIKEAEDEVQEILNNLLVDFIEITSKERKVSVEEINISSEDLNLLYEVGSSNLEKNGRSAIFTIYNFLEVWFNEIEGFERVSHEGKLKYVCLDPSAISSEIFDNVHSAILMSGTLSPLEFYRDLLGIKNPIMKKFPNPFPIENRKIVVVPYSTTRYSRRSEVEYQKIAEVINKLLSKIEGNVMLLFPSYALRDSIVKFISTDKNLLFEKRSMTQRDKIEIIEKLNEGENALFAVIGSNFSEGIDFPGKILDSMIVVGLPLTKPDVIMKVKVDYFEKKFGNGLEYAYYLPTFIKLRQALGRLIRSEEDKGIAYFIDERYAWKKYKKYIPKDWLLEFHSKEIFS